jgi:glyoxylase-like metal-dependent hydrolase (beta-lactamase superfamily II)
MKVYFHLSVEGFSNCYVVTNEETKEALIIDPGVITKDIIEQIEREKYKLVGVLITHNHKSHTRGLQTIRKIYSPVIYAADYDVAGADTFLLKGDGIIRVAGLSVGYMSVPGHTHDSLVYKIGQIIFTGDVLTAGKIGTTNSSYSKKTLLSNIKSKILSQQTDIILMPGHGPPSSVEAERHFNESFSK